MRGRIAVAAALAALAAAPPALAANADVQAVDGPTGVDDNSWSPKDVTVSIGDTVTWHFNTIGAHSVKSTEGNWSIDTDNRSAGAPPAAYTFSAEGLYRFVCELHAEMSGSVTVGNPPPPPPPPLSEQPFANDQAAPTVFEVTDRRRPRLSRVRVAAVGNGARVRFRLSEPGRVTIRIGGRTRTVALRRAGSRSVVVRGLAAGTYRVTVVARDRALNRSRVTRRRVSLPG